MQQQHIFARLRALPMSESRDQALYRVLWLIADENFVREMDLLSTMTDPVLEKALARYSILVWVNGNNGDEETARWLISHGSRYLDAEELRFYLAGVIRNWGSREPRAAMQFTDRPDLDTETLSAFAGAVQSTCMAWGFDDLPGVLAWTTALHDEDPRKNPALLGALHGLTVRAPEQAHAWVEQRYGTNDDTLEMAAIVGRGSLGDPTGAEEWAASLPAQLRNIVLGTMLFTWIMDADVEWLANGGQPQAVQWANSLPPNQARSVAWGYVAAHWSYVDPAPVKDWLRSLPQGSDRDAAIALYDQTIVERAPTRFPGYPSGLLGSLQTDLLDPKFSAEQIRGMLADWASKDPVASTQWAAGHGVPMPAPAVNRP